MPQLGVAEHRARNQVCVRIGTGSFSSADEVGSSGLWKGLNRLGLIQGEMSEETDIRTRNSFCDGLTTLVPVCNFFLEIKAGSSRTLLIQLWSLKQQSQDHLGRPWPGGSAGICILVRSQVA